MIEAEPDHEVADLHVWRIGTASRACIVSSWLTRRGRPLLPPAARRDPGLAHVTVEVSQCAEDEA